MKKVVAEMKGYSTPVVLPLGEPPPIAIEPSVAIISARISRTFYASVSREIGGGRGRREGGHLWHGFIID